MKYPKFPLNPIRWLDTPNAGSGAFLPVEFDAVGAG
jgi:hypothetical protein